MQDVLRGDWKTSEGFGAADVEGSLLCTWCHKCSGMCPWRSSWRCPRCRLGNQADIWGLWPGARLWHPDGRGRRGGWGPEDHLPRVSDSFSLDYHAFNLYPLLRLLSFLPGSPRYLQQSLDILATRVPCNYALFFSTLFLCAVLPLAHLPLFLRLRFPPRTRRRPSPSSFHPPESFFCLSCSISLSFHHHHPPQQSMKNRCHTTLSVICNSMLKARSQRDCVLPWQPAFWCPLLEFALANAFLWMLLLIVPKFTTLIKVFMEQHLFFFSSAVLLSQNGGWAGLGNMKCVKVFLTLIFFPPCTYLLS